METSCPYEGVGFDGVGEKNHGGPWGPSKDTKFKLWVIHHQTRAGPQRPLGPAVPFLGILQQPCLTHISKGGAQSSRNIVCTSIAWTTQMSIRKLDKQTVIQHAMECYAAVKKE